VAGSVQIDSNCMNHKRALMTRGDRLNSSKRENEKSTAGQLLSYLRSLELWARRHSWLLPLWARSTASRVLGRASELNSKKYADIENWSAPLIVRESATATAEIRELPTASASPPTPLDLTSQQLPGGNQSGASGGRLRCLIVTPVLDGGGVDEFVSFLARHLPLRGLDTSVLCAAPSPSERARIGFLASELRREGILVSELLSEEGRQWLGRNRPDVISAHDPPEWVLQAADALRIPVVETLHEVPTPIGTDWDKEPARSRYITTIVAVSELVRRQYLRGNPGFNGAAIVTIPNAFNVSSRSPVDRAKARAWLGLEDEFLFISLARHALQKNAYGLVAAFADVARANPNAHLLISGRVNDRPYTEEVRRLRESVPERERIHLRENLPNPSALLAAADGFVLDSFFEGWPLASMEALSAGLPVIMSDVGGAREQLGLDGTCGYIVPNPLGDPESVSWEAAGRERFRPQANKNELVAAMTSVIRDRERWASVRPNLVAASKQRFSARTCAEQHANVLRRAALDMVPAGR
jgi:glycosyltransferase involved in cell wall biosynthesis